MTTKQRFRQRYRLEIREDDHPPPHVHLTGGGIDAVISLETLTVLQGWAPKALQQEVLQWVRAHQHELLEEWKAWHE
jgi:hypothetical protein